MTQRPRTRIKLAAMPTSPQLPKPADLKLPPIPPEVTREVRNRTKTSVENEAEQAIEAGNVDKAMEILETLQGRDPDNPRVHFLIGKAFGLKGDLFSAIKHFEETIKVDEHFYAAYYLLAQHYAKVNLLDDAIRNYLMYFGVKPQARVAVEIARTYERMGRAEEAKQFYAKANAMNPGNPNVQAQLHQSEGDVANNLYLRANHAFTKEHFDDAVNLFRQALSTPGLDPTYRRDAVRKVEAARLRAEQKRRAARPAQVGYTTTRKEYGTVNLRYSQLADVDFRTRFTGPVQVEWRGHIARKVRRYGRDFLLMIKELSRDELDEMRRDRNDYRLNKNFNNQPLFLVSAPVGGFPPFAREGSQITFTGTTNWRFYEVLNDLGQSVKLPSFEFISAHP